MTTPLTRSAAASAGGRWDRFARSDRRRSWLLCGLAVALVLAFLAIWTTYAGAHQYPRYRQLAPGAASGGSEHYRVTALTATSSVVDEDGEANRAPSNSIWVVAEIEVVTDHQEDPLCALELLGPGGRTWSEPIDRPARKAPSGCDQGVVKPHIPFDYESIYEIPARYAGQLRGLVVVNDLTGAPSQVLSPAR